MYMRTYDEWRSTPELRQNPAYRSFLVAHQDFAVANPFLKVFDDEDRSCKRWTGLDVASSEYLFHVVIDSEEIESTHFVLANLIDAHTTCAEHKDFRMFLQQRESIRAVKMVARSDRQDHACIAFEDGSQLDIPVEAQPETHADSQLAQGAELFAGCELVPGLPIFHVFDCCGVKHRIVSSLPVLDALLEEGADARVYEQTVADGQIRLEEYNPSCSRT